VVLGNLRAVSRKVRKLFEIRTLRQDRLAQNLETGSRLTRAASGEEHGISTAGLLSKVAHDLCIQATDWEAPLEVDGDRFSVEIGVSVRGLRVEGKVEEGRVSPMKDKDHQEIEDYIVGKKILRADRFPRIRYVGRGERGSGEEVRVDGELTLKDATRPLPVQTRVREQDDGFQVEGEVRFKQTTWGIKPFSALLGTLKIQDELRINWELSYRPT
jgi:hypothetical protein